eukprot:1143901-Pelagomonas_calceolata.AAC.1
MSLQNGWNEKIQWLVRYRISAISLGENPAQGVPKRMFLMCVVVTNTKKIGSENGPGVELRAILGRSEARRVIWGPPIFINFLVDMILYEIRMVCMVRFEEDNRERPCPTYGKVVQPCKIA